jgi:hypothetical protein
MKGAAVRYLTLEPPIFSDRPDDMENMPAFQQVTCCGRTLTHCAQVYGRWSPVADSSWWLVLLHLPHQGSSSAWHYLWNENKWLMFRQPEGRGDRDSDCGVCSWPWQLFAIGNADRPLPVTSNRCITVKNTLGWSAVVFCACEVMQLFCVVRVVHKFYFGHQ